MVKHGGSLFSLKQIVLIVGVLRHALLQCKSGAAVSGMGASVGCFTDHFTRHSAHYSTRVTACGLKPRSAALP
ncbi:MAG: hypothetical protein KBF40_01455, partial [Giesbergeria sp.]|nr:hypothetical protein [Giesbergeria sp.]